MTKEGVNATSNLDAVDDADSKPGSNPKRPLPDHSEDEENEEAEEQPFQIQSDDSKERIRGQKYYYYDEMRALALGIKWFGTSISQTALKNLVDKKIRLAQDDKKNSLAAANLRGLRNPKNLERLMHMS